MRLKLNTNPNDFDIVKFVIKTKQNNYDFCKVFVEEITKQACEFLQVDEIDLTTRSRSEPNSSYRCIILALSFQHLYFGGYINMSQLTTLLDVARLNFYTAVKRIDAMSLDKHEISKKTYDCYTYINNQLR
jgi:hypothetical protein